MWQRSLPGYSLDRLEVHGNQFQESCCDLIEIDLRIICQTALAADLKAEMGGPLGVLIGTGVNANQGAGKATIIYFYVRPDHFRPSKK